MPAHLTLVADNAREAEVEADSPNAWVPPPPARQRGKRLREHLIRRVSALQPLSLASESFAQGQSGAGTEIAVRDPRKDLGSDRGAVTAEYAIVIMAAVAFAGLLVAIMRSGEVRQMLIDLVQNALGSAG